MGRTYVNSSLKFMLCRALVRDKKIEKRKILFLNP